MYNITAFTSSDNFFELAYEANKMVDGWLFIGFSFLFCAIIVITLIRRGYPFINSLSAGSFATAIISAVMVFSGLLSWYYGLFWAVVLLGSGALQYMIGD